MRPALFTIAPAIYCVARRLTEGLDDAAMVTRAAAAAVVVGPEDAATFRARAYRALWQALQELWARRGALHTEAVATSADELLLPELVAVDEGELDRRLMSRLDASPDVDVALRRLTAPERFAVMLIDVQDVTREEAAAALDVSVNELSEVLLHARARVFASLVDYVPRKGEPAPETPPCADAHPSLLALQDVLDHHAAGDVRVRIDDHLAACAVCRRQLHALRWTAVRLAGVGCGSTLPVDLQRELRQLVGAAPASSGMPDAGAAPHATGGGRWRHVTRWFTSS